MYNRKDYYVRLYHDNPSHKVFCQSEKLRVAHRVALDAQEPPDYNDCDWTTVLQHKELQQALANTIMGNLKDTQ